MTDATVANLIAYSAQVSIVVAVGAVSALLIRLPTAKGRMAYWRLTLGVCLALPLLARPADRIVFTAESAGNASSRPVPGETVDVERAYSVSAPDAITWLLSAGAAARAAWLGIGILALARLRRRSDAATLPDDVDVLRKAIAPATVIRWHATIAQPVAFGWLRPVVLLPRRVAALPIDAQRAVACHELLHVARRDWLWMLGEETIRCVFWFHPAIWFALEKLQLSREELVDEQVVRITGLRKPYARVLAMFAGEPAAFAAATPFIRRRHLLSRIRRLSEEHTMSRLRIACGVVVLLAVIAGSGWVAIATMPLRDDRVTLVPLPSVAEQSHPPPPVVSALSSSLDLPARNQDAAAPPQQESMDRAASLQKFRESAAELLAALRAAGQPLTVHVAEQSETAWSTLTYRVAPIYPEPATGHGVEAVVTVRVGVGTSGEVTDVEAVRTRLTTERDVTDPTFWASQPSRLFGQAAEDAIRQWRWEPGAVRRFEIPIAFGEQDRMEFVPAARAGGVATTAPSSITPSASRFQTNPSRIRVGGAVRQPAQVYRVAPVYPEAAKTARVEGVVIIEAVIGTDGTVSQAIVVRSIPLLDQAALDAVVQWRYQPTLLNGTPVEVIMTLVVNFTLQ